MQWYIQWTQPYVGWEPIEFPIVDLTLARAVLAKVMTK